MPLPVPDDVDKGPPKPESAVTEPIAGPLVSLCG
jgi:hypothetical protein